MLDVSLLEVGHATSDAIYLLRLTIFEQEVYDGALLHKELHKLRLWVLLHAEQCEL